MRQVELPTPHPGAEAALVTQLEFSCKWQIPSLGAVCNDCLPVTSTCANRRRIISVGLWEEGGCLPGHTFSPNGKSLPYFCYVTFVGSYLKETVVQKRTTFFSFLYTSLHLSWCLVSFCQSVGSYLCVYVPQAWGRSWFIL